MSIIDRLTGRTRPVPKPEAEPVPEAVPDLPVPEGYDPDRHFNHAPRPIPDA